MKERRGILELVFAMLLSGSIGIFVVSSNQPPANVVFFRCIIAFICLVPYCAARGLIRREYFQVRLLLPIIVSGIFLVLNWLLLFKAYPLIDIGLATVIYHVNPFLVILGGAVVLRQAVSRNDILWSAVAFAGLVCLVGAANGALMLGSNVFAGVVLTLSASALYAGTVLLSKASAGVPPAVVVLVQTAVGSLLLAPLADFSALPTSSSEWACLATLGVVHTFFFTAWCSPRIRNSASRRSRYFRSSTLCPPLRSTTSSTATNSAWVNRSARDWCCWVFSASKRDGRRSNCGAR